MGDYRREPVSPSEPPSSVPGTFRILAAVALVATVIGAGIGTAVTLLVGNPGPAGQRGPVGEQGPRGAAGPQGDLSSAQQRVSDLAGRVSGIDSRIRALESSPSSDVSGRLSDLDDRISDLEGLTSDICFQLNLVC